MLKHLLMVDFLVLLDLSAAFETVDHHIMLLRLEQWVGIKGSVLPRFEPYLTERSFSVHLLVPLSLVEEDPFWVQCFSVCMCYCEICLQETQYSSSLLCWWHPGLHVDQVKQTNPLTVSDLVWKNRIHLTSLLALLALWLHLFILLLTIWGRFLMALSIW